ncbi:hypothetical protein [Caulobacter sp. NIBR1757]|uniref:hypothetical protein n=1 Tax=Caulobacter sp. NIBR1757 TaxID=3016000 RepID=UPI0022F0DF9A|nr:hypothetical protein [Caulobacter sp. NIBR1757]WGM41127.1 hypothetical protein AMEJIAPC_04076 [Caulobacter sp. NIBR1757]
MIRKLIVAASVGLLLTGQVAMAAEGARLGGVQGSVLVNQNGRFVPVTSSTVLKAGDRVMAMDGSATVTYGSGCSVAVSARSMAIVGDSATCAGGSSNVVRAAYQDDQEGYGDAPTDPAGQGWDFWTWATFGVITVGAMAVAINDGNDPSSP